MITIVTDSSSCIKKNEAQELGVKIVPINYIVDGKNYLETYSDQNGDFEELLKDNDRCSTSHPNIAAFMSVYEEEINNGNEVLCIPMSSRLSGANSTANVAAKQVENDDIVVFDSHLTAGGLFLLIKETKKLIDEGTTLNEIIKKLPSIRDRIKIAFSVSDMTPLRNGGRMGFVRMSVSTFLNIRPILLCKDGAIVSESVAHGDTEIIKKLAERITESTQEIVINYIGDNRMATNLYNVIQKNHTETPITLQKIGPALGIHLGLKAIAVSYISK